MKTIPKQANGIAVLVGVNKLDPCHFGTSCVELLSPDKDVEDYELIAKLAGLSAQVFLGENATRPKLLSSLNKASKSLKAGDFLLLTFSGYGGLVTNFGNDQIDPVSATWCLYNSQLLLSEIMQVLSTFQEGVNILVIADTSSAFSGLQFQALNGNPNLDRQRALPVEIAETVYLKNKDHYDAIYLGTKSNSTISANVIWLTACQLNQVAYETKHNGYLTSGIKHIWNGGNFKGDYELLIDEVCLTLPAVQSPKIMTYGKAAKMLLSKQIFAL